MTHEIETSRGQNGSWVATVHSLPGLQVYGSTREETLALAETLAAIFSSESDTIIHPS